MPDGGSYYWVSQCSSAEEFVAAFRRYAEGETLFIPTGEPFAAGQRGRIAVALADGSVMIEGDGEIVSAAVSSAGLNGRAGITVRFASLDPRSTEVLGHLVRARAMSRPLPLPIRLGPTPAPAEVPAKIADARARALRSSSSGLQIDRTMAQAECVLVAGDGAAPLQPASSAGSSPVIALASAGGSGARPMPRPGNTSVPPVSMPAASAPAVSRSAGAPASSSARGTTKAAVAPMPRRQNAVARMVSPDTGWDDPAAADEPTADNEATAITDAAPEVPAVDAGSGRTRGGSTAPPPRPAPSSAPRTAPASVPPSRPVAATQPPPRGGRALPGVAPTSADGGLFSAGGADSVEVSGETTSVETGNETRFDLHAAPERDGGDTATDISAAPAWTPAAPAMPPPEWAVVTEMTPASTPALVDDGRDDSGDEPTAAMPVKVAVTPAPSAPAPTAPAPSAPAPSAPAPARTGKPPSEIVRRRKGRIGKDTAEDDMISTWLSDGEAEAEAAEAAAAPPPGGDWWTPIPKAGTGTLRPEFENAAAPVRAAASTSVPPPMAAAATPQVVRREEHTDRIERVERRGLNRTVVILAGAAGVLVVGAIVAFAVSGDRDKTPSRAAPAPAAAASTPPPSDTPTADRAHPAAMPTEARADAAHARTATPAPAAKATTPEPAAKPGTPAKPAEPAITTTARPGAETAPARTAAGSGPCKATFSSVPPGAEVVLGGKVVGATPVDVAMACKAAVATFRRDRYEPAIKKFVPRAAGVAVAAKLERPVYTVKMTSNPPGAVVTLAGRKLGKTPVTTKLPGYEKLVLTFAKDGYAPSSEKLMAKRNGTVVTAALKKAAGKRR